MTLRAVPSGRRRSRWTKPMWSDDTTARWVAALRSGQYVQGHGRLYDTRDDCYCPLGVLCAVKGVPLGDETEQVSAVYDHLQQWLSVQALAAIIALNDLRGYSFAQIAEVIEEAL